MAKLSAPIHDQILKVLVQMWLEGCCTTNAPWLLVLRSTHIEAEMWKTTNFFSLIGNYTLEIDSVIVETFFLSPRCKRSRGELARISQREVAHVVRVVKPLVYAKPKISKPQRQLAPKLSASSQSQPHESCNCHPQANLPAFPHRVSRNLHSVVNGSRTTTKRHVVQRTLRPNARRTSSPGAQRRLLQALHEAARPLLRRRRLLRHLLHDYTPFSRPPLPRHRPQVLPAIQSPSRRCERCYGGF